MQVKIDRRTPALLYRQRCKLRLRDRIPLATIAKYIALTIAGIVLFQYGQAQAFAVRGYEAIGGEVFALFLPGFYWLTVRVIKDTVNDGKRR